MQRALRKHRAGALHRDLGISLRRRITMSILHDARERLAAALARVIVVGNGRQKKLLRRQLGRVQFALNARKFKHRKKRSR